MGVEVSPRRIIILFLVFILCQLGYEFKYQSIAQELPDEEDHTLRHIADKLGLNTARFFRGFTCSSYEIMCGSCDYNDSSKNYICHVTGIALGGSGLTGIIPEELANLTYLRRLNLKSNKLTGTIPASLGKLNWLSNLDLSDNQLSGHIPDTLWSQKLYDPPDKNCDRPDVALCPGRYSRRQGSIVTLDLSSNQLSGPLPANLGNLSFISDDPDFTGNDVALNLYLSYNQLTGPIPVSLGKLSFMNSLDLSNNFLNGPIPESLGSLCSMNYLYLQNNGLSGTLPQTLGNLTELETFAVDGNNLSGPIPESIAKWTHISIIHLVGNHFHGGIPAGVFNLSRLNSLAITDVRDDGADHRFPPAQNLPKLSTLILRNCSFTGQIPSYIGNMTRLRNLDLSFNSLTGGIPDSLEKLNLSLMSFSNNKLSGKIPDWIQNANGSKMDLSYNKFSKPTFEMSNEMSKYLNLFSCCCNSSICLPNTTDPTTKNYCARGKHKYHSLFINCGGGETFSSVDQKVYDQDNDTSQFHLSPKGNWARSSAGNTPNLEYSSNSSNFVKVMRCGLPAEEALYNNARTSPVSLKYHGFCLRRGNYSVTLHFAEIGDDDNDSVRRLPKKKRLFDVYIQGERKLQDFNITENPSQKNFTGVHVNDSTLEIHLYSAGIGLEPGPLISAISVTPEYKLSKGRLSPLHIALISVASIIVFLLLLLVFAWMMGWLGNTDHLKEIDIGLEKRVTLKQLKDATGNFSKRNEIGQGRDWYKAELSGKIVAVKKLSSHPEEKINELKNEFKLLKQDNLVQLLDVYDAKGLHLLIYEYMQNISLENALLDSKFKLKLNWEARFNICLGIAKGLKYLHEHPRLKIVHTGIKSANILLDSNNLMNAKISDIGMASLYKEEDPFKIIKVKVTEGYMAPEYVLGLETYKADVYSFGVVILETVSGRKNCRHTGDGHESQFLTDMAGDLKRKGKLVELVDKTLSNNYDAKQAIIILNLAVLCINISPSVRPTMSAVLSVLKDDKKIEEICSPARKELIKDTNDPHVREIAQFAVSEYNKKSGKKLELQSVVNGETQAVDGQNYRLVLAVRDDSVEAKYEGVVYERFWEHRKELLSFDSHIAQVNSSVSMEATSRVNTSSSSIKGEDETEHISENTL